MTDANGLPAYDELPKIEALGLPQAWDALPRDLGTLSLLTPERVVAAAGLVRTGEVVNLNLPLDEPDPPLFGREPLKHTVFELDRNTVDDRLDSFYPQASSQWDGLRHIRCREHGFFGGVEVPLEPGPGELGIERWDSGIVGRGVLIDLLRHRESQGRTIDAFASEAIGPEELAEAAEAQGLELRTGDVICVRTGWIASYRALDEERRAEMAKQPAITGLAGSDEMARFLWDHHPAALALDNPSVEVAPGDPAVGSLHRRLIPTLGFALAELLDFDRLSELCAADGRWEFLFVAVPLNLPGGIGSPANAVAIR